MPHEQSGPPSVLVVEDDADFGELLVEHLRVGGRRVLWARDGAEALGVLARSNGSVGLVLLDLRMPVMDGFEVCRRLDSAEASPGLPVVVMTAEQEVRDVRASRRVVAVLHKPLELDRLDALVDAHLG